ncbi:hypothetical protein JAAARDRAFT_64290 [Jaapia argillacea MUCL 33604]|uniref:Btz domain-containing protein n=1 Tax=Jaapia argillacea MUCL 33604 TaxID=933084 RepID=A0A067QBL8_9AGAM|nr:hypothetical protein JAAARDRAFT_64290 [Jaapia argillacea MUCL 33604]
MPVPVSSSSTTTIHKAGQPAVAPVKGHARVKKARIARRRGRATGLVESDEEIEREARSDSGTEDDHSSFGTDTESESELDDLANGHSPVVTPSTTQSPQPPGTDDVASVSDHTPSKILQNGDGSIFVSAGLDWSEMVAEENKNGPAELPVIDFADLGSHPIEERVRPAQRPHKSQRNAKKQVASAPPVVEPSPALHSEEVAAVVETAEEDTQVASEPSSPHHSTRGSFPKRPPGQTARQAYQRRLESDPSYVPVIGEFNLHDDRLCPPDLRSLSGWWRGRWQGRGRGRGGFGMRGRGRGGFVGMQGQQQSQDESPTAEEPSTPVDRPWTHDGFEEMRRRDEQRRSREQQQQRGAPFFRGRGGFVARGRGGFARGFAPSPTKSRHNLPPVAASSDRPWFAMKPEQMWTKKHEAFLYVDPGLKPRAGVGQGFRIRLPGKTTAMARAPPRTSSASTSTVPITAPVPDEAEGRTIVRLPRRAGKEKADDTVPVVIDSPSANPPTAVAPVEEEIRESITTVADVPAATVVPSSSVLPTLLGIPVRNASALLSTPEAGPSKLPELSPSSKPFTPSNPPPQVAEPQVQPAESEETSPLQQAEEGGSWQVPPSEEQSTFSVNGDRPPPPVLPPLQTSFSPVSQSPPNYPSPYAYPQLPPGIAMNQHGMPYELATGRPVYLQPTPPPPPMYTPRPMMHSHVPLSSSVPFVPGHTPHHSLHSPDFFSHSPTPPMNGFVDPSTGTPLFTLPRQSSRIEIRAPTDHPDGKPSVRPAHRPSGLRATMVASEPVQPLEPPAPQETEYYMPETERMSSPGQDSQRGVPQPMDPTAMPYNPYQQPYFYPEQYGAYPPYMDMSQISYDMYPPDPRNPQPAVYY